VLGLQRGEPLLRQLLGTLLDQLVDPVPGHEQAPLRQMLKDRLGFLSTDVAGDREPTRERVQHLADRSLAWTAAKLTPIGLHECRHTCASIFIAAGVNAKALSSYLGHSSITITLDRYGHLMPGSEDEAVALVDDYLERSTGAETGASGTQTAPLRGL
jgi:integrase